MIFRRKYIRQLERTVADQARAIAALTDRLGLPLPEQEIRDERATPNRYLARPENLPE